MLIDNRMLRVMSGLVECGGFALDADQSLSVWRRMMLSCNYNNARGGGGLHKKLLPISFVSRKESLECNEKIGIVMAF